METIKEMRERHKKEIKKLQEECPHPEYEWSEWIQYHWAIAHYSGWDIRICNLCGKEMDRRSGWNSKE